MCCHIHTYVAIYTDMLPHTQICCHIHRYAAIYTKMLPYTQICCHIHNIHRYAAIYTDMLPCTQICCHIHRYAVIYTDYGKKVLPRRNIAQLEKYRFLAPAHSIFFVLRRFLFLYRAPSGSTKKKKRPPGGGAVLEDPYWHPEPQEWTHPAPPPSTPHTPIHPQDQPCERALAPALRPLPFLFVCFLLCSNSQKNKKCEIRLSNSHFLFFWGGPPGRRLAPDVFFEFFREI